MQESKEPKSSEEKRFVQAINASNIILRPVEELREILRLVIVKVGLRAENWPNDVEKSVLIEHIVTNYGSHTNEEIKLAFDMAISGRLDLAERDISCYESFSCLYFSKIMNAYRKWASKNYVYMVKEEVKQIEKEDLNERTMAEWYKEIERRIVVDKMKLDFIPLSIYEWIDKQGGINITDEQRISYNQKAAMYRKEFLANQLLKYDSEENRVMLENFRKMIKQGYIQGKEYNIVDSLSKKMILYDMIVEKNK